MEREFDSDLTMNYRARHVTQIQRALAFTPDNEADGPVLKQVKTTVCLVISL